jgi:(p)ppGpp synthase/HD superfamily hydrolase
MDGIGIKASLILADISAKQLDASQATAMTSHAARVAMRVYTAGFRGPTVAAAWLHDLPTIQGSDLHLARRELGDAVADLITTVSTDTSDPAIIVRWSNDAKAIRMAEYADILATADRIPHDTSRQSATRIRLLLHALSPVDGGLRAEIVHRLSTITHS